MSNSKAKESTWSKSGEQHYLAVSRIVGRARQVVPDIRQKFRPQKLIHGDRYTFGRLDRGGFLASFVGGLCFAPGLKSHPKEGDRVKIVLLFSPGNQQVDVEVAVLKQEPK